MKFLRFKDLKQRNIVRNWTTLTRLMREQDFPAGTRVGAQARAWDEAEVAGVAGKPSHRLGPRARAALS